ncbi:MAG: c-type cytochrome [Sulfitobacter sp.]
MKTLIFSIFISSLSVCAQAEEQKEIDAIDARQAYYRILEYNMGALGAMASGNVAYDAAQVEIYVGNLMTMEQYATASLFPLGTSKDDMPGRTRALANIWTDFPSVAAKGTALQDALLNLEAVSGDSPEALGRALGQVGGACMACHKSHVADNF